MQNENTPSLVFLVCIGTYFCKATKSSLSLPCNLVASSCSTALPALIACAPALQTATESLDCNEPLENFQRQMSLLHMSCITLSSMDEELRCIFACIRDHHTLPQYFTTHRRLDEVSRIENKHPFAVLPAFARILLAEELKDRNKTQISLSNGRFFWTGVICQRMRQFNCTLEATGEYLRGCCQRWSTSLDMPSVCMALTWRCSSSGGGGKP